MDIQKAEENFKGVSEKFQKRGFEKKKWIRQIVKLLIFGKIDKNHMLKMLKMWKKRNL